MPRSDSKDRNGRLGPPLRGLAALISLAALLVSGAAAGDGAFPYDQGGSGLSTARLATRVLQPALAAASLRRDGPEAAEVMRELMRSARKGGLDPRDVLASTLPPPSSILALLALDRDVDDFGENAARGGLAGAYYHDEALLTERIRPQRPSYFAAFDAAYQELGPSTSHDVSGPASSRMRDGVLPYGQDSGITRPQRSDLAYAHPFALDLFFTDVRRHSDGQEGPVIHSLSPGIVIAAASNWKGGAGLESWVGGGLSPSAGNGVIVYDPVNKRVFSYFHLRHTALRTGDVVRVDSPLGVGGNTGVNARRPGHGGHLHVEVYDVAKDRPLNSYQILDLVTAK